MLTGEKKTLHSSNQTMKYNHFITNSHWYGQRMQLYHLLSISSEYY